MLLVVVAQKQDCFTEDQDFPQGKPLRFTFQGSTTRVTEVQPTHPQNHISCNQGEVLTAETAEFSPPLGFTQSSLSGLLTLVNGAELAWVPPPCKPGFPTLPWQATWGWGGHRRHLKDSR